MARKGASKPETISKPRYILIAIVLIAIAALIYLYIIRPAPAEESCSVQNITQNTTITTKHNAYDVQRFIGRVMDSYTDLSNAQPTTPVFLLQENIWEETVILNQSRKAVRIRVYDSNLTLESVFVEGPNPTVLSNDEIVAAGVVKLNGKINCSQGKVNALVFFDLYCPPCIAGEKTIEELKQKFNASVDFQYKIVLTHSYDLATKYGLENVSKADGYLVCAKQQGMLDDLKQCMTDAYTKHEEVPLSPDEMSRCINSTSLNITALDDCMGSYALNINLDRMAAETYSLVGTTTTEPAGTPVVVIDCQYKAQPQYAEAAICYAHPDLKECK